MHNFHMGEVTVSEDHLLDSLAPDNVGKVFFCKDRNPIGVQWPGEFRGKEAIFDSGNLSGCEGHHLCCGIIAVRDLEIMKIPSRRTHDDNSGSLHIFSGGHDLISEYSKMDPVASLGKAVSPPPPFLASFLLSHAHLLCDKIWGGCNAQ
jgi:hypothetical protein